MFNHVIERKLIEIYINGVPKGQPRPRSFIMGGKARVYNPSTAEGWKNAIAAAFQMFIPEKPYEGPLSVSIWFRMPRPKSHYRTGKFSNLLKDSAPEFHLQKPDLDNMVKAVLDCLVHIRYIVDDDEIAVLNTGKWWSGRDESGATIIVERLL